MFDMTVGAAALILLLPIALAAALAVKLFDGGPVWFVQERTGQDGRRFRALKFRTMTAGRRPDPDEIVGSGHAEVTWVGKALRRFRIDEVPQLINVLRGEMSLIGPRPTLPEQTDGYDVFARERLRVRPGLTGLAQVNGNTSIPWAERIRYDVHYVRHGGFWMDLGILCKTVAVVLLGERRFARPFESSRYARREMSLMTGSEVAK